MILRRVALSLATVVAVFTTTPAARADSVRDQQWHLTFLHIAEAHQISQGEGVLVAVEDSGVDATVPELSGAVVAGKDFGGGTHDGRYDTDGHGTAMATLIAGRGRGAGNGVLGIAPKATILPVQVASYLGFGGNAEDLAAGIDYAVERGAKVISISLGTNDLPVMRTAIQKALAADVVIVAAVGNKPKSDDVEFPANVPGVVAVGAVDKSGERAAVSVAGPEVALVAPGTDIVSRNLGGAARTGTGTSDSTAIVSGAAALVRSKYPQLSGPEVVRRLTLTAQDKGEPGRDPVFGYGVLDIVKALTAEIPPAASPQPSAPPGEGDGKGPAVVAAIGVAVVVMVFIAVLQIIIRGRRQRR
ncbi:S8 family serine peptidase [Dactylosporangium sp. CS-047395]|uniref:S8 family serine peptidase n=1 Tax=Dactylosporangium sp. CS-047395 TaxID=3239936 RepID=UPI003D8BC62C